MKLDKQTLWDMMVDLSSLIYNVSCVGEPEKYVINSGTPVHWPHDCLFESHKTEA